MTSITVSDTQAFLTKCISSLNENKLHGMRAEASFRAHIKSLGATDRVSPGGWIFRKKGELDFGESTVAVFPHTIVPGKNYSAVPNRGDVPFPLHTICATMHQIGINSYYAHPILAKGSSPDAVEWQFIQLGVPWLTNFVSVDVAFSGFLTRSKRYNYLRYKTDVSSLSPSDCVVQFSHESVRIYIENKFMAETSDIDAIVWGDRYTYPMEIKEKEVAHDKDIGDWFGLDTGPFVKLAHYAARKGNLHSLFVVREIEDRKTRKFKQWLITEFDNLAQQASWVPRPGGPGMGGASSMVVRVPRKAFRPLDATALSEI